MRRTTRLHNVQPLDLAFDLLNDQSLDMLDLNDLAFFVRVVELRGFTAAASSLGVSKSTLSQRVARLEDQLGVRLIERTSRHFVVTDVGRELHGHASAMLIEADAAENAVRERLAEPRGTVRLSCSIGMTKGLAPLLVRFASRFPRVNVAQHATNRFVDLVAEGFDVGLRGHLGPLADSDMIQRQIARPPWYLVAAPTYLDAAGTPTCPAELAQHDCLVVPNHLGETTWVLRHDDARTERLDVKARLASDDMDTLVAAAEAGLGIAAVPAYRSRDERASGRLRHVLPGWTTGIAAITLLIPPRRARLPAVRALVDFLVTAYPPMLVTDGSGEEARTFATTETRTHGPGRRGRRPTGPHQAAFERTT